MRYLSGSTNVEALFSQLETIPLAALQNGEFSRKRLSMLNNLSIILVLTEVCKDADNQEIVEQALAVERAAIALRFSIKKHHDIETIRSRWQSFVSETTLLCEIANPAITPVCEALLLGEIDGRPIEEFS